MKLTYSEGFEEMPLVRAESQSTIIAPDMWNNTKSGGSLKEEPSPWKRSYAVVTRNLHGTRVRFSSRSWRSWRVRVCATPGSYAPARKGHFKAEVSTQTHCLFSNRYHLIRFVWVLSAGSLIDEYPDWLNSQSICWTQGCPHWFVRRIR